MAAGSLPSVHPLCLFPFGCWVLFIGHIPPEYETDWDLRPFAAMLVHGHMSPPATKCKEICACALGGNLCLVMLNLKLQYFGHLMRRVDLLKKTLMLGGIVAGGEGDDRG